MTLHTQAQAHHAGRFTSQAVARAWPVRQLLAQQSRIRPRRYTVLLLLVVLHRRMHSLVNCLVNGLVNLHRRNFRSALRGVQ